MTLPILCLDFDGVLHSYTSGWQGADVVGDPPVPGAIDFLLDAAKYFDIAVCSSRSYQPGGVVAMKEWLVRAMAAEAGCDYETARGAVEGLRWPLEKPPAFLTIDDRALTFTGRWPDPEELLRFRPWNKGETNRATGPIGLASDDELEKSIIEAVAQAWCEPKNEKKEMDADLAYAIVGKVRALVGAWRDTAKYHLRNEEYYRGLVARVGEMLGEEAYVSDDGSRQQEVLCAKVPELVQKRLARGPLGDGVVAESH